MNRAFPPRNDALDLGSDMNTERCNTQGCELQQDTKMLLQDWGEVRSKQQMYQSVQPQTETQILKGAKSVFQFQTVTHGWSR